MSRSKKQFDAVTSVFEDLIPDTQEGLLVRWLRRFFHLDAHSTRLALPPPRRRPADHQSQAPRPPRP